MNNYLWKIELAQLDGKLSCVSFERNRSWNQYKINSDLRAERIENIFNKLENNKISIYDNGIGIYNILNN